MKTITYFIQTYLFVILSGCIHESISDNDLIGSYKGLFVHIEIDPEEGEGEPDIIDTVYEISRRENRLNLSLGPNACYIPLKHTGDGNIILDQMSCVHPDLQCDHLIYDGSGEFTKDPRHLKITFNTLWTCLDGNVYNFKAVFDSY